MQSAKQWRFIKSHVLILVREKAGLHYTMLSARRKISHPYQLEQITRVCITPSSPPVLRALPRFLLAAY
jgi:hypothetical protein